MAHGIHGDLDKAEELNEGELQFDLDWPRDVSWYGYHGCDNTVTYGAQKDRQKARRAETVKRGRANQDFVLQVLLID